MSETEKPIVEKLDPQKHAGIEPWKEPIVVQPGHSWKPCFFCGGRFDEAKDPDHRENCRDAVKP